jgi:hypothetical protein
MVDPAGLPAKAVVDGRLWLTLNLGPCYFGREPFRINTENHISDLLSQDDNLGVDPCTRRGRF